MSSAEIITLSNFLRNEGMIISIRSTITASWIWENYKEYTSPSEMKESLKCIYVKNKEDIPKFNRIYDQLFEKTRTKNKNNSKQQTRKNKNKNEISEVQPSNTDSTHQQKNNENRELIEKRKSKKIINDKLSQDSILTLDESDRRIFDICQRLSRKIANQRSKRKKKYNSHNINMPYTIRQNLKNGGHLIKLTHQKPPLRKTKQIFLCDISGSCQWVSAWFFAIIYGCYKTFDKIKVYDFDNKTTDVTSTLTKDFSSTHQINIAHQSLGIRAYGQSDMTSSFKEFLDKAELNNHTDVIILTDCRDWNGTYEDGVLESAKLLHQIVIKSRKVLILNPEKKIRWNNPTSYVSEYEHAGAKIYETCTLNQFANVISKL